MRPVRVVLTPKVWDLQMYVYENAGCKNAAPWFDDFKGPMVPEALATCAACTVRQECLQVVRPTESFFDGVAGGIVWREGKRVG